jgi:hypothetical protein
MRWAQDHHQLLKACDSEMPGLHNRKADTWRLLFVIAILAVGMWPQKVKAAAILLAEQGDENASYEVLLLRGIRRIYKISTHKMACRPLIL